MNVIDAHMNHEAVAYINNFKGIALLRTIKPYVLTNCNAFNPYSIYYHLSTLEHTSQDILKISYHFFNLI
ncbi:hypothetical protein acsn021_18950 [Anaerocolumna cellulosilytica]|uniref:Uncharacterized protein n=1 Tax=Anaerocolumna cellulosilytica TaxID=433286 RepID=A0A6S6QX75_9FIRM|nr:hypothetical protein acsn021_18950 [Anaerocolumna cellulosilytica]